MSSYSRKDCKFCGKLFHRGFNLRRHEEYCPMRTQTHSGTMRTTGGINHASNSTIYNRDQSLNMAEEEDNIIHTDEDDVSTASEEEEEEEEEDHNSQSEDSEYESELDDHDEEDESDPWLPLKQEAKQRHYEDYEELVQNFINQGEDEDVANVKAYTVILPKLKKELRTVYLERLLWLRELRRDPIHKKVMQTRDKFSDNDDFDPEEALEAAVIQRKFILKKLLQDGNVFEEDENLEDVSS